MAEGEPSAEGVEWYDRGLRLGLDRGSTERERMERQIRRLRGAVGLLNSMVLCGEAHSPKSKAIVADALKTD